MKLLEKIMTKIAKAIVKNQLWVITDGSKKIGNIESINNQFSVKIGDKIEYYTDTKNIEQNVNVKFEKIPLAKPKTPPFAVWPTTKKCVYNNYWDVKRRIHVFTKNRSSKCYYAAGYFNIKMANEWQTVKCPKYIFIQRYEYEGPFHNESDAKVALNIRQGETLNE